MNLSRVLKLLSLIKGLVQGKYDRASQLMSEMHGLPQKLGQHLTLYQEDMGQFDRYFKSLCVKGKEERIPVEQVLTELSLAFNKVELYAQASIGQVYKVQTEDGLLAAKLQYPQVEKKVTSDFTFLRSLLFPIKFLPLRNSSLLQVVDSINLMILRECDYIREAHCQKEFSQLFSDDDEISVPQVAAFNNKAIVSRWSAGTNLTEIGVRLDEWFIRTYLKFIVKSLKRLGQVHADPHPGNFIIRENPDGSKCLTVVDFGAVVQFDSAESAAIVRLLLGEYENLSELERDLLVLGIDQDLLDIYKPIIGDLVSILFEPLYYPGEYSFMDWRLQYKMNTLLGSRAWERPLAAPYKLIMLMRALQGLYFYARKNFVVINWHETIKTYLG